MTPRRWTALALLIGIALVAAPSRAPAHEEVPGVRAVLDAIEPPLPPGVLVQVRISAADQLVVENTTSADLEVLGSAGELLFRIGPDGTIVNLRSPDWYRSVNPGGTAEVPPDADPARAPRLARVSSDPAWGWFDHRLHEKTLTRAPDTGGRDRVVLETWSIPMRYDGEPLTVTGHREYQVPRGAFESRVESAPDGLLVTVLNGTVPALNVKAEGQEDVRLLGASGEPFAHFDGDGVEVNEASPTWALTAAGRAGAAAPEPRGPAEAPRWRRESRTRQLTWLEQRAVFEAGEPPEDAVQADGPTDLLEWEVPVVIDGEQETIAGVTRWVPRSITGARSGPEPKETAGGSARLALIAVAGAGAALALWQGGRLVRDRRRRPS